MGWDVQCRSNLGEDILLARHGARIRALVVVSGGGVTTALLDDGSVDAASNHRLQTGPAPLDHLLLLLLQWLDSVKRIERAEVRFWAWTAAAFLAALMLIVVLLVAGVLPTSTDSTTAIAP